MCGWLTFLIRLQQFSEILIRGHILKTTHVVIVAEHAFSATASAFMFDSGTKARSLASQKANPGRSDQPVFVDTVEFYHDASIANILVQRGSGARPWFHLYPTQFCSVRRLAAVQQLISFIWDKPSVGVTWCIARSGESGDVLTKPTMLVPSHHSIREAIDFRPAAILQAAKQLLPWSIVPDEKEPLFIDINVYRAAITKMLQKTWNMAQLSGCCPWPAAQEVAIAHYLQQCVFDEAGSSCDASQFLDFQVTDDSDE